LIEPTFEQIYSRKKVSYKNRKVYIHLFLEKFRENIEKYMARGEYIVLTTLNRKENVQVFESPVEEDWAFDFLGRR
jgi:hypothetical protein